MPAFELLARVVEERDPEVEQARGHRLPVDEHVPFGQVPAARPNEQRRGLVREPVLASVGTRHLDRPADRVGDVDLSLDHVRPGRSVRVLEVGHEAPSAAVQGVDHHLAIGGPRDLDPAVLQVGRRGCHPPVRLADRTRRLEEVRPLPFVEPGLSFGTGLEQLRAPPAELALQPGDERERLVGQDLVEPGLRRTQDLDALGVGHVSLLSGPRAARPARAPWFRRPRPRRRRRTRPRTAGTAAGW